MQDAPGGQEETSVSADAPALMLWAWAFIYTEQASSTRGPENDVVIEWQKLKENFRLRELFSFETIFHSFGVDQMVCPKHRSEAG